MERRSFGTIMNSFYELESEYADYSRQVLGKRAWTIGPISLCINRNNSDKAMRGKKAAIDELDCLKWLDSKHPNSVIYVSFGSQADIPSAQLREIAIALEASELNFIWVIKTTQKTSSEQQQQEVEEEWLPDSEFEERNREKGLIIRGWAPQVLVLDHQATGAFVTHCGWNSVLEGISAGMPMVTWPLFAEQFLSEKQVVEILKIGVPVRSKKLCSRYEGVVRAEAIRMAMERVMTRNEAVEIRRRADELKKMALRAVQTGGSSHEGLNDLLKELKSCQINDRIKT